MVNGSSERKGPVIGARSVCEEFCHEGLGHDRDGDKAHDSVYGTTYVPLSLLLSNTQLEKVKQFA